MLELSVAMDSLRHRRRRHWPTPAACEASSARPWSSRGQPSFLELHSDLTARQPHYFYLILTRQIKISSSSISLSFPDFASFLPRVCAKFATLVDACVAGSLFGSFWAGVAGYRAPRYRP